MKKTSIYVLSLFVITMLILPMAHASEKAETEILVDQAISIVESFTTGPGLDWFRKKIKEAKALLIIPQNLNGAFLIGGSGGSGVLIARDSSTGEWSYPAFYTLEADPVGLQIGAEASQVILLIMTDKGMEILLTGSVQLGADITVAAGQVAEGMTDKTADMLSYSRSKGFFAALSLDGAVVKARDSWNKAYYDKEVSPADIFIRKIVSAAHAEGLRNVVSEITAQ